MNRLELINVYPVFIGSLFVKIMDERHYWRKLKFGKEKIYVKENFND
jgi:hypothetical protein